MKEKIHRNATERQTCSLNSELNAANRINAINSFVIQVTTYSFGITKWSLINIQMMDGKIRKVFTKWYRMHHPKSDVDRIYLSPRKNRWKGPDISRTNYEASNNKPWNVPKYNKWCPLMYCPEAWRFQACFSHETKSEI